MAKCEHTNFSSTVEVYRLADEKGNITGYSASVVVKCVECSLPFRFLGLQRGLDMKKPMVNVDETELRVPIEPAYVRLAK